MTASDPVYPSYRDLVKKQLQAEKVLGAVVPQQALRHNEGKPEMGYILEYPNALEALVRVMEHGAKKYARNNWKLGNKPDSEYLDAAMRHLFKHNSEGYFDKESNCLHIAHAVWNLMTLIELNLKGVKNIDNPSTS